MCCVFISTYVAPINVSDHFEQVEILSKDIVEARSAFSARLLEGHGLLVRSLVGCIPNLIDCA